jgi:hypothetical protein
MERYRLAVGPVRPRVPEPGRWDLNGLIHLAAPRSGAFFQGS